MNSRDKIQHLLITHLLKEGSIEIALPQGMHLALGMTKEGKRGTQIQDNYCWSSLQQDDVEISLDKYNLGVRFGTDRMIFEENDEDTHILEVV